jgi:uncharacterized protein YegP (UPF0339 family)
MAKIEITKNIFDQWWWRLVADNNKVICSSEMFPSKSHAIRAAKRAQVMMKDWKTRIEVK